MLIEIAVFLIGTAMTTTLSGGLPLPVKRDIPANFSTVICADEQKARIFITDFIAPNQTRTDLDIELFFGGLICRSPQSARAAIVGLTRAKQARLRGNRLCASTKALLSPLHKCRPTK
jgi:hypothetical protein